MGFYGYVGLTFLAVVVYLFIRRPKWAWILLGTAFLLFAGIFVWAWYSTVGTALREHSAAYNPADYVSGTWRYRMAVSIETPEGMKASSAVREVYVRTGRSFFPGTGGAKIKVTGEAAVIDLGPRGLVFALMRGDKMGVDYGADVFLYTFGRKGGVGSLTPEGVRYFNSLPVGTTEDLTHDADKLPMFVRFKDINDPKTVERVDPADMAATLGAGVRLKAVSIEITDAPVTEGIEKYLPWLGPLQGRYLNGKHTSRGSPFGLYGGDFQKGTDQ